MRSQERKKAGGKRKAETNYVEAYSGASQLAPPPSAKDVAALPSKLRKLIHLKASLSRGLPSNPSPLSSLNQSKHNSSKTKNGRGFQSGSIPKPADHLPKNSNSVANRVDNDQSRLPSTTANLSAKKSKSSATGGDDDEDHSKFVSKTADRSAKRSKSLATGREAEDQLELVSKAGDRSAGRTESSTIGGDDEDGSGISDGIVDATKKRKKAGFASRWKRDEAELAMLVEKMDKRSKTGVSAGFGERRKSYLKEKKKKRRKNNQEHLEDDVPAMNRYEKVEFGEVVMAPPKLSFPGRAAEVKRKEGLKGEQAVSNERLRISNEKLRLDVIEAYRKQKVWSSRPGQQLPAVGAPN